MLEYHYDSYTIVIGKNAKQNWELLDDAIDDNIWLHLNDYPSPYVIIKLSPNYKIKHKDIKLAGRLCKQYSKYKNLKNIEVCYLKAKYVKKGEHLGEAILLQESKTMNIK